MRQLLAPLACLCLAAQAPAPAPQAPAPAPAPLSPNEALVQRQIDAYNAHDAQAYAACFAPQAQLIRHPGILLCGSREELYKGLVRSFKDHKNAHIRILYRTALGPNQIVEHQVLENVEAQPLPGVVIYSLQGGLIQAAWLVSPE